jgi:hypothetical protein
MRPIEEDLDGYAVAAKIGADEHAVYLRGATLGAGGCRRPILLTALHPHVRGRRDLADSFESASRRWTDLLDPRLLAVEALGTSGERTYRVSPLVPAWSLPALLDHVRRSDVAFGAAGCFWIAAQVADALTQAGERAPGFVHGDLRPESVFVLGDASIRLAPPLLEPGALAGARDTAFVAPEVLEGAEPDARADVYGLAHVLWHALGVVSQREEACGAAELARRHPALCEGFLLPALSVTPADRPHDVATLGDRLSSVPGVHAGAAALARFVLAAPRQAGTFVGLPETRETPTTIHAAPGDVRPEERSGPKLRVVGSEARVLALGGSAARWVVGRGRAADLVLEDADASREHFEILRTDAGKLVAYDLGSKNGLYANGREVDSHPLAAGDELRAGTTVLRFEP